MTTDAHDEAVQAAAEAIRNALGISSPAFMQRQAAAAAVAAAAPILAAAERSHNPNDERIEQALADAESEVARLRDLLSGCVAKSALDATVRRAEMAEAVVASVEALLADEWTDEPPSVNYPEGRRLYRWPANLRDSLRAALAAAQDAPAPTPTGEATP